MKCKNCGHDREHHKSSGGLTFCDAMIARAPIQELCHCHKFEEVE